MFYIAVAHSCFNVLNTFMFLPFVSLIEKLSIALVPKGTKDVDIGTQYLEKHLLDSPELALELVHKETVYMAGISQKAVQSAMESVFEKDLKKTKKARELESLTDHLQAEITQYIVLLSQRSLTIEQSKELPVIIHTVNDLERVGDLAQTIAELK